MSELLDLPNASSAIALRVYRGIGGSCLSVMPGLPGTGKIAAAAAARGSDGVYWSIETMKDALRCAKTPALMKEQHFSNEVERAAAEQNLDLDRLDSVRTPATAF